MTEKDKTKSFSLNIYKKIVAQAWSLWSLLIRYCRSKVRQLTVYNIMQRFPTSYVSKPLWPNLFTWKTKKKIKFIFDVKKKQFKNKYGLTSLKLFG